MNYKSLTALALILPIAACGGATSEAVQDVADGGTTLPATVADLPTIADAADLTVEELDALIEEFSAEFEELADQLDYTDLSALATSGSIDYVGLLAAAEIESTGDLFEEEDIQLVGEVSISLDLQTDTLTGDVTNLTYVEDGEELAGEVEITGILDRSVNLDEFYGISGEISGDLTDSEGPFSVAVDFDADLLGEDAEVLAGGGEGSILIDDKEAGIIAVGFGLIEESLVE